ncbi:MAG: MFS transporter, partial [Bacteroidota bacterium]
MTMLVAAGECVFLLPFVVARIFRPTFLDVFQLSNFELGSAFSLYGVVAIAAYFFGGPLADRFSARKLMAVALLTTSVGGIVMSSVPSLTILTILYGFWGLTTILLFWAALIKATRQWGYPDFQGRAFGILDGGRGLFAALLSSISVVIFAALLPADVESASLAERTAALSQIIWIFSIMAAVVGILIWFVIPDNDLSGTDKATRINLKDVFQVLKMPQIWLQAVIVICAYMGYKLTDYFSLYPKDAFGYDEVEAAQMGTISFWVRPFAALGAGLLADRIGSASKVTIWSFVIMMFGCLIVAFDLVAPDIWVILALTVAVTSLGV